MLAASQQRRATESNGSPTTEPVNALCLVAQPPTRLRTAHPVPPALAVRAPIRFPGGARCGLAHSNPHASWLLVAGAVSGFGSELKLAHAPFAFLTTNTAGHLPSFSWPWCGRPSSKCPCVLMPGHYPYRKGSPGCRRYSPPTAGRSLLSVLYRNIVWQKRPRHGDDRGKTPAAANWRARIWGPATPAEEIYSKGE